VVRGAVLSLCWQLWSVAWIAAPAAVVINSVGGWALLHTR